MKQFLELVQLQILPEEQRIQVSEKFNIKKSGNIEVVDNQIASDGIMPNDVAIVNVGRCIEYLGFVPKCANTNNFFDLCWEKTLEKMFGKKDDEENVEQKDEQVEEVEKSSQPETKEPTVLSDEERKTINETSN